MNHTENEIGEMAEVSNFLADLWQYEYSPDASGSDMQMYMNPLHILQNALNLIIEQRKIICEYKEKTGN